MRRSRRFFGDFAEISSQPGAAAFLPPHPASPSPSSELWVQKPHFCAMGEKLPFPAAEPPLPSRAPGGSRRIPADPSIPGSSQSRRRRRMRMKVRMRMRLEFLLLVAAAFASCSSQTGHDPSEDSRRDSRRDFRDSPRDSRRDSGSAAPRLLPAPLLLQLPPEPGPPRIRCLAPRRFTGSTFELLRGVPGLPVRSVPAAPDRHWADFSLPGAARCFRCRYRSHNGSAWLESEPSPGTGGSDLGDTECQPSTGTAAGPAPTAGTVRDGTGTARNGTGTLQNDPSWLLPVSVGAAVPGLLLLLGAAAVGWRGGRGARNREFGGARNREFRGLRTGNFEGFRTGNSGGFGTGDSGGFSAQGPPPRPAGASWPPVPPVLSSQGSGGGADRATRCRPRASPWPPRRRRCPREGSRLSPPPSR
ncbi:translation initiation factor IF-2-like isoform X2 [Vidua chalybeata]|uniref:translation initiation factor IF-2-like isoform X2 n=1 Tax=Vidua chalybeata TaxID=81927 RepID=UPI0023A8F0AB|nr:translation initiation factor IF-2-like isoform X2 [Vidua chalybeata]